MAASSYSVASNKAYLLGATSYITSQYLTVLITQSHNPAAAEDFLTTLLGSNSGFVRY